MAKTNGRFEGLLARYFEGLMRDDPVFATISAGLASGEGRLGSLGKRFHEKRERARQSALRELEGQSPRDLTNEQQIDRLALRSRLLRECEDYARGRHQLEPNAAEHLLGVLFHELRRGPEQPARAASNLRSLIAQAPEFLDEAAKTLSRPEQVWLKVMEGTVAGGELLLKGIGAFFKEHGQNTRDDGGLAATFKALRRYRDHARDLRRAPPGSFAI